MNTQARPNRNAPRYPTLKPEAYYDLDPGEKRRADLHADIDAIIDAEPRARLDRDAIGFSSTCRPLDGSRPTDRSALNGVERASQALDQATPWLAAVAAVTKSVSALGRTARFNWPPPLPAGLTVSQDGQEVTVGRRSNQIPVCAWCGDPAPSGRHPNGKTMVNRVGDYAVHAQPCYQQAYRQSGQDGTDIAVAIASRLRERTAIARRPSGRPA